ncbi:MAG TPA: iron-containing redox enzyme family protein [Candidatus Binataceae bacterium]|nr:iron-containing redox enzyme family protein [Candidatus Binataceae bacterium]
MDKTRFHAEIDKIVSDYDLTKHPYVELISTGKASREQLKRYPIEHWAMTVKDSGPLAALGYLRLREIDLEAAHRFAQSFSEEALGTYSHSASHTELLYEMWERGLGMARRQLDESIGSEESLAANALFYRIAYVKPHFLGAFGLGEGAEVYAYKKLQIGLEQHYGIKTSDLRFLDVHYEADKDHSEAGHWLIDRLVTGSGREQEFLAEARTLVHAFWKGFDSMLAA